MARTTGGRRASGKIGWRESPSPIRKTRHRLQTQPRQGKALLNQFARWDLALAAFAGLCWFAGHVSGTVSTYAIPAWVVSGIALGLLRPRLGMLVTILVVPYLGGAADLAQAEVLRVVPILGSAVRIGADRLGGRRMLGTPHGEMVGLAVVAAGLFMVTAFTAYLGRPNAEGLVLGALPWLVGAPVAFLAAWIAGGHAVDLADYEVADVVAISTVSACLFALAAWWGASWTAPFAYPADVTGRLSAFGYPTPTGIGLAIALPFAVAAAHRRHAVAGIAVPLLGLATIVLTGSRGPLIALGIAGLVAFAVSGRLGIRALVVGSGVAIIVAVAAVAVKYGTTIEQIRSVFAEVNAGDAQRVQSWRDAIDVTLRDPLTGGGWGSLSRAQDPGLAGIAASHNMILSAFADGGLPLGIAFGGVVLYSIARMWSNRSRLPAYAIAGAMVLLVTGLWDIPNLRSYGAIIGGFALGLVTRRDEPPR